MLDTFASPAIRNWDKGLVWNSVVQLASLQKYVQVGLAKHVVSSGGGQSENQLPRFAATPILKTNTHHSMCDTICGINHPYQPTLLYVAHNI